LFPGKHWINPVLYVELENLNGANKSQLTVVGHDGIDDLSAPTDEARRESERAIEGKLILDSFFKGWTLAENLIVDIRHGPYEYGYALGLYPPLEGEAMPGHCNLCLSNMQAGLEMYGGLGTNSSLGLHNTSHYLAPVVSRTLSNGIRLKFSPNFGLTETSAGFLMRFGASAEVEDCGGAITKLFHGRRP
jgi:hypothetical protein